MHKPVPPQTASGLLRETAFDNFAQLLVKEPTKIEKWFETTCEILERLIANKYTGAQEQFERKTYAYVKIVERIVNDEENPRVCRGDRRVLSEGLDMIVDKANSVIVPEVTEMEIALFCLLAESGWSMFEDAGLDPNEFLSVNLLTLAQYIRHNFAAYEESLQALPCR